MPDVFASTLALAPIQSRFFATLEKTAPRVYDLNELVHVPSFSLRAQRIPFAKFSPFSSIAALRSRISWDDAVREGLIAHMQVDTSGDLWSLTTRTTPDATIPTRSTSLSLSPPPFWPIVTLPTRKLERPHEPI